MASSLVEKFEDSVKKLPMRDAVRYTSIANGKWTAMELKVNILAIYLLLLFLLYPLLHSAKSRCSCQWTTRSWFFTRRNNCSLDGRMPRKSNYFSLNFSAFSYLFTTKKYLLIIFHLRISACELTCRCQSRLHRGGYRPQYQHRPAAKGGFEACRRQSYHLSPTYGIL